MIYFEVHPWDGIMYATHGISRVIGTDRNALRNNIILFSKHQLWRSGISSKLIFTSWVITPGIVRIITITYVCMHVYMYRVITLQRDKCCTRCI